MRKAIVLAAVLGVTLPIVTASGQEAKRLPSMNGNWEVNFRIIRSDESQETGKASATTWACKQNEYETVDCLSREGSTLHGSVGDQMGTPLVELAMKQPRADETWTGIFVATDKVEGTFNGRYVKAGWLGIWYGYEGTWTATKSQ